MARHERITHKNRIGELKRILTILAPGDSVEPLNTRVLKYLMTVTPAKRGAVAVEDDPAGPMEVRVEKRWLLGEKVTVERGPAVLPALEAVKKEVLSSGGAFLWRGASWHDPAPATVKAGQGSCLVIAIPGESGPVGLLELESEAGQEPLGELDLEFILEFVALWGRRLREALDKDRPPS